MKKPRDRSNAIYVILPDDLKAQFDAHLDATGASIRDEVVLALRRHLAYPPVRPEIPPLPDAETRKSAENTGKTRRKKI